MTLPELSALFTALPAQCRLPHRVVVVDTETTELPYKPRAQNPDKRGSRAASVCEIGAILLDTDGMPLDLLHLLITPDEWPDEPGLSRALAVSGLTHEQLTQEGIPLEHARQALRTWWLESGPGLTPWVAFNTEFDKLMLELTFRRANPAATLPPTCGCIMLAAKAAMAPRGLLTPSPEWAQRRGDLWQHPKASAAMEAFGVVREHVHAALFDAADEALILCAMARQGLPPWR